MDVRWLGRIGYQEAWDLQKVVHAEVVAGAPDVLLLLEHPPTFTAGRRTDPGDRPSDPSVPVVEVDRGGEITWHGPGQLVGYPIVRLSPLAQAGLQTRDGLVDVVGHVRRIETGLIAVCASLGVEAFRVEGRSGVWTQPPPASGRFQQEKVGAIGIRVQRGVTMHGFALNCDNDLAAFDTFTACGIHDAGVTTLSRLLGRAVTLEEARGLVEQHLAPLLSAAVVSPAA